MPDRQRITPLPVAAWDPSLARVIDDMHGQPLNVHALMANHPELLNAWWNFRNHMVTGGSLGKRCGELVILRVASKVRSWYEWAAHVERAQACGLSLEEIERVRMDPQADGWTSAETLLLRAVDELLADRAITTDTLELLADHYDSRQILDLVALQGMYVILAGMLNTWPVELDRQVREKLPPGMTREHFDREPVRS